MGEEDWRVTFVEKELEEKSGEAMIRRAHGRIFH